jgi:cell division protein FtsB
MTTNTPLRDFGIKVHVHAALGKPFFYAREDAKKFAEALAQVEDAVTTWPLVRDEYYRLKAENKKLKAEVAGLKWQIKLSAWFMYPVVFVLTNATGLL